MRRGNVSALKQQHQTKVMKSNDCIGNFPDIESGPQFKKKRILNT